MVVRLLGVVSLLVAGTLAATAVTASAAPAKPAAAPTPTPGYTPLTQARLLDTRPLGQTVDNMFAAGGPLGAAQTLDLTVVGRGGVPASGVSAVVLNVTATQPTGPSFVTVYPTGTTRPNASNLNFVTGQTIPNLVIVKVGATGASAGKVTFYNNLNSTHLLADVAGWFATGTDYTSLNPARLLDTRGGGTTIDGVDAGVGPLGPAGSGDLQVTGRGGVPASGVAAVVLNVTVTQPTAGSFLTVFPTGATRPNASNLNFNPGQTIPNLVIVQVGTGGDVRLYNNLGATHVVADVEGWFPVGSDFTSVVPARLLDTRPGFTTVDGMGAPGVPVGAGQSIDLLVTGRGGVPATNVGAVVLNVTATQPTGSSFATVYPTGSSRPNASNLNFNPGQTIPNLVIAKVGTGGKVTIYNNVGTTHFVADVEGWFSGLPPTAAPVPGTSLLNGVACPTATACLAVGFDPAVHGVVVPLTSGSPGAPASVSGNSGLNSVACDNATSCIAVGQGASHLGQMVSLTAAGVVAGTPTDVPGTFSLDGVACAPGTTTCVAVGSTAFQTVQSAAVPILDGTPGPAVPIANVLLVAVACPTATLCLGVGFNSAAVGVVVPLTITPVAATMTSSATTTVVAGAAKPVTGTAYLDAIACPNTTCQAGGATASGGAGQGVVDLIAADGTPGAAIVVPGTISLDGIGCASATLCEVGGQTGAGLAALLSMDVGKPSAPAGVAGAAFLAGVACPSTTTCEGVGQNTATSGPSGVIVAIAAG